MDSAEINRMARPSGQQLQILKLRPAIPLTEWMDVVHIADDNCRLPRKVRWGQSDEKSRSYQAPVNIGHARVNVLTELKLLRAFADFDRSDFTSPVVDVLKQVAMKGLQMSEIEFAVGHAFPAL